MDFSNGIRLSDSPTVDLLAVDNQRLVANALRTACQGRHTPLLFVVAHEAGYLNDQELHDALTDSWPAAADAPSVIVERLLVRRLQ